MTADHPSRLALARMTSGELPLAEKEAMGLHVDGCPRCAAALSELEANTSAFLGNETARLSALQARIAQQPRHGTRWLRPLLSVCAIMAAAAIGFVALPMGEPFDEPAFKGEASLRVVVRHGDEQRDLGDSEAVSAGDALRLVVTAASPVYVAAAWLDAAGTASLLYPQEEGSEPLRIEGRGPQALEGSFVIDEAPGEEQLLWVVAPKPFSVRDFLDAARRGQWSGALQEPGVKKGAIRVRKAR